MFERNAFSCLANSDGRYLAIELSAHRDRFTVLRNPIMYRTIQPQYSSLGISFFNRMGKVQTKWFGYNGFSELLILLRLWRRMA